MEAKKRRQKTGKTFLNNKKGVEMSLQLVITAALMLLVLSVLSYFLLSTIRGADGTINVCEDVGGDCRNACLGEAQRYAFGDRACPGGEVCCRIPGTDLQNREIS